MIITVVQRYRPSCEVCGRVSRDVGEAGEAAPPICRLMANNVYQDDEDGSGGDEDDGNNDNEDFGKDKDGEDDDYEEDNGDDDDLDQDDFLDNISSYRYQPFPNISSILTSISATFEKLLSSARVT